MHTHFHVYTFTETQPKKNIKRHRDARKFAVCFCLWGPHENNVADSFFSSRNWKRPEKGDSKPASFCHSQLVILSFKKEFFGL
jgi:hypothetical protein